MNLRETQAKPSRLWSTSGSQNTAALKAITDELLVVDDVIDHNSTHPIEWLSAESSSGMGLHRSSKKAVGSRKATDGLKSTLSYF